MSFSTSVASNTASPMAPAAASSTVPSSFRQVIAMSCQMSSGINNFLASEM